MSQQHPSLHGDPDAEIAARSADGSDGRFWLRDVVYRVPRGRALDLERFDHTANLAGTVQAAVQNGVHPKGEPEFAGAREHPTAPGNHILTYAVPVVPAVADTDPQGTVHPAQAAQAAQAASAETVPPAKDTAKPDGRSAPK